MEEVKEQKPPSPAHGDVWNLVLQDMQERRQLGIERYNMPVQPFNGRESLVDAYQEELDKIVYMRQAIIEQRMGVEETSDGLTTFYSLDRTDPPLRVPRAPGWRKLANDWIATNPKCEVCGRKESSVPHHVIPVHIDPSQELVSGNLLTLCPVHHLWIGHLGRWRSFNVNAREDAREWFYKISARP